MKFIAGYMRPEIGDFVYKAFRPQTPGKAIEIIEGPTHVAGTGKIWKEADRVRIKWINGEITIENSLFLKDFRALIADHEKKLATHRSKLAKLESLDGS